MGNCLHHEMLPVGGCHLPIPQVQQVVPKSHLVVILSRLAYDLIQNDGLVEGLVGYSTLVGQLVSGVRGVQGEVHYWRELTEVAKENRISSEDSVCLMWEDLSQSSVDLPKHLPPNHRHFVDDQVLGARKSILQLLQTIILYTGLSQEGQGVNGECSLQRCRLQLRSVRLPELCPAGAVVSSESGMTCLFLLSPR